jgi:hypothetical protein
MPGVSEYKTRKENKPAAHRSIADSDQKYRSYPSFYSAMLEKGSNEYQRSISIQA